MSKSTHTPGRLRLKPRSDTTLIGSDGFIVCSTDSAMMHRGHAQTHNDALHIMACWNACEGKDMVHSQRFIEKLAIRAAGDTLVRDLVLPKGVRKQLFTLGGLFSRVRDLPDDLTTIKGVGAISAKVIYRAIVARGLAEVRV